jgi:cation:H+ antiporter
MLLLVAGIVCAAVGGELFVRGSVGIATALRISPSIIGVTVAAFATSSPELSVAVGSGLAGTSELSLGDVLGSNIVNFALVLACALLIADIPVAIPALRRDIFTTIAVPLLTALLLIDGILSRADGLIMLGFFMIWISAALYEAAMQRKASSGGAPVAGPLPAAVHTLAGLGLLVAAGFLIITGATGIARSFGLHEFLIGATIVAFGTSMPELASIIISRIRWHEGIGFGTILGSNIFNGLFIIAVASLLSPISAEPGEVLPSLLFGLAAVLAALPLPGAGRIRRWQGMLLLLLYVVYPAFETKVFR